MPTTVRLVHLILLVRRARQCPDDVPARAIATSLAAALFALDVSHWISTLLHHGTLTISPTSSAHVKEQVPYSFCFPSTNLLPLLLHY